MPRPSIEYRSASKESYIAFCKKNPEVKIKFRDFEKVLRTYNTLFARYILETGERLKMPFGIGPLTINKYKPRRTKILQDGREVPNLAMDWIATKREGKPIYILNNHTEGYRYYWAWFPRESYMKQAHIWSFKIARVHSRILAVYLKKRDSIHKHMYKEWVKDKTL